jgi:site-specific recombinase XerD
MTKNCQPWEANVPPQVEPLLRQYIDDARPWLMARHSACHPFLWVNDRGKPVPADYLSRCVALATERLMGVNVPIHFFRDAAATTLARTSPADAKLIRPLLGHLNFETADRHYIQAQFIAAGRDYAKKLTALKSGR